MIDASAARLSRHPAPSWVAEFRDHQTTAIKEINEAYANGASVVMLDAPTGSGKTLIGQQVAGELDVPALYVCSDKQLQDQFARDFTSVGARVIKGRNNYLTVNGPSDKTAEDCTAHGPDDGCWYCDGYHECPYQIAKMNAMRANMAVLNTSYLLAAANYTTKRDFSGRGLVIADECDTLENALLGFVELRVGERIAKDCGMEAPKKAVRKPTLINWLNEFAIKVEQRANLVRMEERERKRLIALAKECKWVANEIQYDIDANAEDEDVGKWLRSYDERDKAALMLQPVLVNKYGNKYLWRHGKKWLLMSATIISGQEIADSLGISMPWEVVSVESTFSVENRPVIMAPVANVTYKEMDEAIPQLIQAIKGILLRHDRTDKVLVHAVSYKLARALVDGISGQCDRPILTYTNARDRQAVLGRYLRTPGAVLVAPSMERGVDLADDACRVQVIVKCPYPALGDRRVSARQRLTEPNGRLWYDVQTIRDIVQMCGRGVRHERDYCTTYILDKQFATNLWARNKLLFPKYWRDALDTRFPVHELMR